jgi:hypothetical protein
MSPDFLQCSGRQDNTGGLLSIPAVPLYGTHCKMIGIRFVGASIGTFPAIEIENVTYDSYSGARIHAHAGGPRHL